LYRKTITLILNKMGRILKIQKFTTLFEGVIVAAGAALVMTLVYFVSPGLRVAVSKQLSGLNLSSDNLNNVTKGAKLPVASESVSTQVGNKGLIRIAEYAWNGNAGMLAANGGPRTTQGSLMEASGVNLELVRIDGVNDLRNMQVKFVEEFSKGAQYPSSDKSAVGVSIMGDGIPFYLSTTQKSIDEKFGKGKYHVQVVGAYGLSFGEDKVIGPRIWKDNPQSMRGCVISSVIGDGDWVVACNYAFANKIPVNPDAKTYDPNAINFVPSPNDDYIESVKDLIKSQKSGYTVPLKEVKDGKLTGKTINHKIDGATTWTPGDKIAFDALTGFTDVVSTKDFVNQMATTLVVVKEWALQHEKEMVALLKQTYTASNQIKQYDEWAIRASQAAAKTYGIDKNGNKMGEQGEAKYWYDLFKGQKASPAQVTKNGGLDYNIGGSKVFNYADAMQYYGITDGNNRYKAVYNQVSNYLTQLNPCDFNETCKEGVVPFEDAVNLYFLKSVSDVDAGKTEKITYTDTKTTVMANGQWNINFETGSATISGSTKDLETIYNLLIQAEETKLNVVGYTDNVGNPASNVTLSKGRAQSVVSYLTGRGISKDRFQLVDGKGDANPVGDNNTTSGKAKNRRVEITLLK
jgi:outer membrane protein OmpA-like peptidoglycan-associated protein